jgi:peroxiredoxin Q/BCP
LSGELHQLGIAPAFMGGSMSLLENKPAPSFELSGSDGKMHALESYVGKTVVLYFYPRDNTPGCTKEACGFRDLKPMLDTMDVVLLGISKDSLKSHDKFIRDFGLPFTLLSDPDAVMMQAYGAYGEKVQYGKKSMGTIRSTVVVGPDGTVVKHWRKVAKAETHPQEVLDFLRKQAKG